MSQAVRVALRATAFVVAASLMLLGGAVLAIVSRGQGTAFGGVVGALILLLGLGLGYLAFANRKSP